MLCHEIIFSVLVLGLLCKLTSYKRSMSKFNMPEQQSTENNSLTNDTNVFKTNKENVEQCCSNKPAYEITYDYVSKTWMVCLSCLELEPFRTGIKEKVRISI